MACGVIRRPFIWALSDVYGEEPQTQLKLQLTLGNAVPSTDEPEVQQPETPSGAQPAWAPWSIRLSPGEQPVICETASGDQVAMVHGGEEKAFNRALLLQREPSLLEAVRSAKKVFALVADGQLELDSATALELLCALEAALELLDDPGDLSDGPNQAINQQARLAEAAAFIDPNDCSD